ncbi:MAG: sensor histidine kinase [Vulcanimicrobiota bacterium]
MVRTWLDQLLLGRLSDGQRWVWIGVLLLLILSAPLLDLLGDPHFHLNLYPLPIILAVFLFRERGLLMVGVMMGVYSLVQFHRSTGSAAMMVNNFFELLVLSLVGVVCHGLVKSYRRLYRRESELAAARQEVLMTLTHELRSPLFAAQGTIESLLRGFERMSPEQLRQQLQAAGVAITLVNREVEGITQLFRVESGKLRVHPQPLQLEEVFEGVRSRHPEVSHPAHRLVFAGGELQLRADRLLLTQALDNLVTNAFRHAPGGRVEVAATVTEQKVIIVIQDEGPGIANKDRQRIFERYERGEGETPGFGIGLYLAREYLCAQGGELTLESSPRGARFVASLPLEELHGDHPSGDS